MRKRGLLLCLLLLLTATVGQAEEQGQALPGATPRYLVICVDGVDYELAAELYEEGKLRHFLPPAPVINAFPSLTNLGLVEILTPLQAPPARGYEDYFFDARRNHMAGGLFYRLSRKRFVDMTFRGLFNYHPHPISMTADYALPVLGPWLNGAINVVALKAAFRKSDAPVFLAYFDSSDLAAHLYGKWLVRYQLRQLDRLAGELRSDPAHPVEVVLFADHGNHRHRLRKVDLGAALRRHGFRVRSQLSDEHSVVLPRFGLVSAAVVYTAAGEEAAVARAVLDAKGVDLAAYRESGPIIVTGAAGTARVDRKLLGQERRFRYRVLEGDPLRLLPVLAVLREQGRVDEEEFVSEEDWLLATAEHTYPDPLRRLWEAFEGLVEQPASVIVSLDDGHYAGSPWLALFAWMGATHGNLGRGQSRGVVLSTDPALFLPDAGPFTGENLLERIFAARNSRLPLAARIWLPAVLTEPHSPSD